MQVNGKHDFIRAEPALEGIVSSWKIVDQRTSLHTFRKQRNVQHCSVHSRDVSKCKELDKWIGLFRGYHFDCKAISWPLHDGEPAELRRNPPKGLGELHLQAVINHYVDYIESLEDLPLLVGHSVGGLIVQKLIELNLGKAGVALASVAPNRMLAFDWSFFVNAFQITNPFVGDQIFEMTAEGFHQVFANTLSAAESEIAYEQYATHDSRNILRDCLMETGHIDLKVPHAPLLFISAEKDEIIPPELCEKNAKAYDDRKAFVVIICFRTVVTICAGSQGGSWLQPMLRISWFHIDNLSLNPHIA